MEKSHFKHLHFFAVHFLYQFYFNKLLFLSPLGFKPVLRSTDAGDFFFLIQDLRNTCQTGRSLEKNRLTLIIKREQNEVFIDCTLHHNHCSHIWLE